MPPKSDNLVFMRSGGSGTGDLPMEAMPGSWRTFTQSFTNPNQADAFWYFIRNKSASVGSAQYEWGSGHVDGTSGDLVRDTVHGSSNGGNLVNFGPGTLLVTSERPWGHHPHKEVYDFADGTPYTVNHGFPIVAPHVTVYDEDAIQNLGELNKQNLPIENAQEGQFDLQGPSDLNTRIIVTP